MKPIKFTKDYSAKYKDSNIEKSEHTILLPKNSLNVEDVSSQASVNRGKHLGRTKLEYLSCFKKQKSIGYKLNEKTADSLGKVSKSELYLNSIRNTSTNQKKELQRRSTLPICLGNVGLANKSTMDVERVQKILRLFQMTYDHFLKEGKGSQKSERKTFRPDIMAAQVVEEKFGRCSPSIGAIPGVKIGDKFNFRVELALVGLHMPPISGIGTNFSVVASPNENRLCTSVVATGRFYENDMKDPNYLVYSGHGGIGGDGKQEAEDQKLLSGNLALLNSRRLQNEVRVIRGRKENGKQIYIYDGLYLVDSCYRVRGSSGKLVFKFGLRRIPEPKLSNAK